MGVTVQQLPTTGWRDSDCTYIPVHIRALFYEYLKRYRNFETLRRKETNSFLLVLSIGIISLTNFIYLTSIPVFLFLGLFIIFIHFLRRYIILKKSVAHAYVNVHILHHHILGKLEVGFCEHESPCQCVEQFRKFVLRKYRISFYGNII
jgi:hypothetical protein